MSPQPGRSAGRNRPSKQAGRRRSLKTTERKPPPVTLEMPNARGTQSLWTHRWREVDSNFRFRVRCKRRLKAKIGGFGSMPPSIICGCRRWRSAQAQSEISEPSPYRARNRKFESISLQRGVCELSVPCRASNFRFGSPAARRPLARSVQPESNMRPGSTPRVLPAHTDLGFAPLSTTSRFARTKADRWSFVTRPERGV